MLFVTIAAAGPLLAGTATVTTTTIEKFKFCFLATTKRRLLNLKQAPHYKGKVKVFTL